MTEHDQGVCLRCGQPAGNHRFCESCRSQFETWCCGRPAARGSDAIHSVAPAAGEVRLEEAGVGGDGRSDRITAKSSVGAGPVDSDPSLAESLTAHVRDGAVESDKLSTGAEASSRPQQPRDVARFEEVLTERGGDPELAVYAQADAAGEPHGATNLGVLLEQRGDLEGALAAYGRADRRGDVDGSFNLGCLLAEMGDVPGAIAALRRADERGDAGGASNLGVLLEREGDHDGALAAYRRADERGDARGAFNLGLLLAARGELPGARAAYQRAAERGDPEVRERARAAADAMPTEVDSAPTAATETRASTHRALHAVGPEADPGPDAAASQTVVVTTDPPEAAAQPFVQANREQFVDRRRMSHAPPSRWVAALCILALLGLVAVLAGRGLRSTR